MEAIVIKQVPNPNYPKLGMKYVGSNEYLVPKIGKDGKRITGFDENALDLLNYEGADKAEKIKKVKKDREDLEKVLGVDLRPHSSYWDDFFVVLNDEQTLDPTNPKDRLIEKFLLANKFVAPSEDEIIDNEDYRQCTYFFYRDKEETTKKAAKAMKKDRATSKLISLSENNPNKLKVLYSFMFGINEDDVSVEKAYVKLREFLDVPGSDEQKKNVDRFLEAVEKSPEEMQIKLILDKAVKKKIILTRGNIYRRGETVFGNSYDEAVEYLSSPEHSGELISLQKEVGK